MAGRQLGNGGLPSLSNPGGQRQQSYASAFTATTPADTDSLLGPVEDGGSSLADDASVFALDSDVGGGFGSFGPPGSGKLGSGRSTATSASGLGGLGRTHTAAVTDASPMALPPAVGSANPRAFPPVVFDNGQANAHNAPSSLPRSQPGAALAGGGAAGAFAPTAAPAVNNRATARPGGRTGTGGNSGGGRQSATDSVVSSTATRTVSVRCARLSCLYLCVAAAPPLLFELDVMYVYSRGVGHL